MEFLTAALPWAAGGLVLVFALLVLRRPAGALARMLARTGVGLCVLAAINWLGGFIGVTLGVNLANALVLGVLGGPGLGLLLMVNWVFRT